MLKLMGKKIFTILPPGTINKLGMVQTIYLGGGGRCQVVIKKHCIFCLNIFFTYRKVCVSYVNFSPPDRSV